MSSSLQEIPADVQQQYEKICGDQHFDKAQVLRDLLKQLLICAVGDPDRTYSPKELLPKIEDEEGDEFQKRVAKHNSSMVRLRHALQLYYGAPGKNDPIYIELSAHGGRAIIHRCSKEHYDAGLNERPAHAPDARRVLHDPGPLEDGSDAAFEEFFGDAASTSGHNGRIIVQSDTIDELVKEFLPNLNETLDGKPLNRIFKARTWVNAWDTEGAKAVLALFQDRGLKSPELLIRDRNSRETLQSPASFEIAMGLGFTKKSGPVLETCREWLRVYHGPDCGDTISLHPELVRQTKPPRLQLIECDDGFWRVLPLDWKTNYIASWAQIASVRDYAILFRHTLVRPDKRRLVMFVLAGFTERSTAIAGRYLARNWVRFWRTYVEGRGSKKARGFGDFMVVIEGPSWPDNFEWWSEDHDFTVTPEILRDKNIKCEWSDRLTA